MEDFFLEIPTKIYFGKNALNKAIENERDMFAGNILIVTTGRSLYRLGYIQQLNNIISSINTVSNVFVWDKISANPELNEIKDAINYVSNKKINIVIGFGGGSSIDAAKAVAAGLGCINSNISLESMYYDGKEPLDDTLPVIAIPTTAGTGSELSKGAIISSAKDKIKKGIRGKNIYPVLAIVNPEYTYSIPYQVTMETGFDVLSHAIESYISKKSNNFSRMLSDKAISIVGEMLPRLADDINDNEARDMMSYASLIMGINVGNIGNALPHRMQYPIGAHTGTSHGAGLLALYPAWVKYEYDFSEQKIKHIVSLLTGENKNSKEEVLEAFNHFIDVLHCRKSLKELGLKKDNIPELISEISGNIQNDPISENPDNIKRIYYQAFE